MKVNPRLPPEERHLKAKEERTMKIMSSSCLYALGIVAMLATQACAGDTELLVNTLAEKGIITYGEARQILTEGKEDARTSLARGDVDTLPSWIQNISMKGDVRLRQQMDWDASKLYPRSRERLRLRLGFDTRVVDNLKAGFGLATGSEMTSGTSIIDAEPTSTNHTFGNGFAKAMLMADYAFLEYTPYSWLKITGGKMRAGANVWHTTDLLWDPDINPDGIAVTTSRDISSSVNVFLTGSWLIENENGFPATTPPLANPDVYIAQPGASWKVNDMINVKGAIGYEQFNFKGKNTGYYANGLGAYDYLCWTPGLQFDMKEIVGAYSLSLFGDMVTNTDPKPASDKDGSNYGFRFGNEKITDFGQWQAVYMLRRLEANAWPNKLGDSDTYGGKVDSSGYEAIFTLGLTKASTLVIDYYNMDKITNPTAATPASLIQFDIVYKF